MEDELFFGLMFIVATIYMLRKSRDMSWRTKADAAVLELGQRAGLAHSTHDADQAPSLLGGMQLPEKQQRLQGRFRGRRVTIEPIVKYSGFGIAPDRHTFTYTCVTIRNRAHLFLKIRPDSPAGMQLVTGEGDGRQEAFARQVVGLLAGKYARPGASGLSDLPYIRVEESELVCWQNGLFEDADAQLGVLNALCDVAELAEEMGSTRGLPESVMETAAPAGVFLSELERTAAGH